MIQLERASKPAVPIVSHGFEALVDVTAKVRGLPLQYVVVPHGYKSLTPEQAIAQTEPVVDDIVKLLTSPAERSAAGASTMQAGEISFDGADRFEAFEKFNDAFLDSDWG